jgi:hypothetical protein
MKAEFNLRSKWALCTLVEWGIVQFIAACAPCHTLAQLALPNFSIIGQNPSSLAELWKNPEARITPRHLAIDYTATRVIYGFTCEYAWDTNSFALLKKAIEGELKVPAKVERPSFCLWRSEQRKVTITLEADAQNMCVRLIVVSVDKSIRKSVSSLQSTANYLYTDLSRVGHPPLTALKAQIREKGASCNLVPTAIKHITYYCCLNSGILPSFSRSDERG